MLGLFCYLGERLTSDILVLKGDRKPDLPYESAALIVFRLACR